MAARISKAGIKIEDLTNEDLYGVLIRARGENHDLPPQRIQRDLFAAEDLVEKYLQIRLNETRVFGDAETRMSDVVTDPALKLTDFDETVDISESPYDFTPDLFQQSDGFPRIMLNYKPVRGAITRVIFTWPGWTKVWQVPGDWLRVDRKFGWIDIVPSRGAAILLTYAGWLLAVRAGGRGAPQSIVCDYNCGFTPALLAAQHQDLLKAIRLKTILSIFGILSAALMPTGASNTSLSIDGQSESRGWAGGPYKAAIDLALAEFKDIMSNWKDSEKGITVAWG